MSHWAGFGASVTGAAHLRQGRPSQDAFAHCETDDGVVAVVADGHGATRHPRSARGARLAADLLTARLRSADLDPSALAPAVDDFVRLWREAVATDLSAHALDDTELAGMGHDDATPEFARRAYGTTVLGIRATADWVSAVAIGDGELGCVDSAATHLPLCETRARIGVETDSLAADDPSRVVRVQSRPAAGVVAVWACTDGFSEAQDDPRWRSLVAGQLHALRGGTDTLADDLRGWLEPAAQTGGDDTTMVLVLRRD